MLKHQIIFLALFSYIGYGQERSVIKYNTVFTQVDLILANNYNKPTKKPKYYTTGFSIGLDFGITESYQSNFNWKIGYRYIHNYANYDAIGFSNNAQTIDNNYNYNGLWTGPSFIIGQKHKWECSIILGGGRMHRKTPKITNGEMEFAVQTGYKFVSKNDFALRLGVSSNFGRNVFFSPLYSGYLSVGYVIKKSNTKVQKKTKQARYFSISISPYLLSLTLDIIGLDAQFDHFIFNNENINIGYNIAGRRALNFDGDIQTSFNVGLIGLFGSNNHKFELSFGPNFPINYDYPELYEFVHFGMGYRWISKQEKIIIRLGSSTTSILRFGVGVRFAKGD